MIKLLSIVSFIALTGAALAQSPVPLLSGGTNNIPAATTNTATTYTLGRFPGSQTAISADVKLNGAGTSAVTFIFDRSLDGSNWDTGTTYTLSITANGTNTVTGITNLTVGGVGYLRLKSLGNANASAVTNLTMKYTVKDGF